MIVPPLTVCVTAQAPWAPWNVCLGFVGPLHTHRHWWLFYLIWQNFADMNCRSSELDASHSAWYDNMISLWKKNNRTNILANHTLKPSNATSQSLILHFLAKPSCFCGVTSISVLVGFLFYPFLLNKSWDFEGAQHICTLFCSETHFNWLANKKCFIWLFSTAKLPSNARIASIAVREGPL